MPSAGVTSAAVVDAGPAPGRTEVLRARVHVALHAGSAGPGCPADPRVLATSDGSWAVATALRLAYR